MKNIKALFPAKVQVTQETIDNANRLDISNCIGARTLKSIVPEDYHNRVYWGNNSGIIFCNDNHVLEDDSNTFIRAYNEQGVPVRLMDIKKPCEVVLEIMSYEKWI